MTEKHRQLSPGCGTSAIAQAAVDLGADLIAMSTRGRGGLARAVLGSTATATLERSIVPLLLVGPAAVTSSLSESGEVAKSQENTSGDVAEVADAEAAQGTANPSARTVPATLATRAGDAVEEQGWQSFPASDPPSWTGSTI